MILSNIFAIDAQCSAMCLVNFRKATVFTSGDRGGDPAATLDSENQQDKVLEVVVKKLGQAAGGLGEGKNSNVDEGVS